MKANGAPWAYCWLKYGTYLLHVNTNIIYHHSMTFFSWLSPKAKKVRKYVSQMQGGGNLQVFEHGWLSNFLFFANMDYS